MNAKALFSSLVLCASCAGAEPPADSGDGKRSTTEPAGEGRTKLWLSWESEGTDPVLAVNFKRGATAAPRLAEIRLAHTESLKFLTSEAGSSTKNASKELIAQEPSPGLVRLIVLARNATELEDGEIAKLKFHRADAGHAKVDIVMDKAVFAPAAAMQGLVIGDPLEL